MLSFYSAFGGWIRKETKEVLSKIIKNILKHVVDSSTFINDYDVRLREIKQFEVAGLPNVNDCYFLRMIASTLQGNMSSYYLRLSSPDVGDKGAIIVAKIIKGAITTNLFVHFREITE